MKKGIIIKLAIVAVAAIVIVVIIFANKVSGRYDLVSDDGEPVTLMFDVADNLYFDAQNEVLYFNVGESDNLDENGWVYRIENDKVILGGDGGLQFYLEYKKDGDTLYVGGYEWKKHR
jgi:hypothetical protein